MLSYFWPEYTLAVSLDLHIEMFLKGAKIELLIAFLIGIKIKFRL
jgi:hypothetical protein